MSERLTDEERVSFRAYAEESRTEEDGTECQWASYTIRALDEIDLLREAMRECVSLFGGGSTSQWEAVEAKMRERLEAGR